MTTSGWGVVVVGADGVIWVGCGLILFVCTVRVSRNCWLLGTPVLSGEIVRGCRAWCERALMVTVEVDPARVESRLMSGGDLVSVVSVGGARGLGPRPFATHRRVGGVGPSSSFSVSGVLGDACVVAGVVVAA